MSTTLDRLLPEAPPELDTLPRLLRHRAVSHPERIAFRHKDLGIWRPVTWATYHEEVEAVCLGLRSLGVSSGDRVAIHSENRPEWVFADLAIESLGAIAVGVYPTNPATEVNYLLGDSGARVLIAEDQEQVDKTLAVIDGHPTLTHVVVIDPKGLRDYRNPHLLMWDELVKRGRAAAKAEPVAFTEFIDATRPSDVACIVYTSGTTGPPKGAMLTHTNTLAGARALIDGLGIEADDTTVSYLPLCHVAERIWTLYVSLLVGVTVNFAESVDTVQSDIYETAPTFFGAVPRIAEKIQAGVDIRIADSSALKRALYGWGMRVGRKIASRRLSGEPLSSIDHLANAVAWVTLFRPLRERLGLKRVRHALIGAAAVSPELMEYFHALGVPVRQTYGQTECGGSSHLHRIDDIRFDTVGTALSGYECRTAPETGEVLLRGEGVFAGYWGKPEATEATLRDGWLHTGDIGEIDLDGHLHIVGRIKDIIVTAGGKNISPQEIENKLKFSPYVREAVVLGEGRKYLAALIGIEYDTVAHWAEQRGLAYTTYRDLAGRKEVVDLIDDWIYAVNGDLAQVETIKRFSLIPKELDHDDDELTATQKVRRSAIEVKFSELIDGLYRDAS
jgi:long-chain acyl-CoA synthetase